MSTTPCTVTIASVTNPQLQFANARGGASTTYAVLFEIPAGTSGIKVLGAVEDEAGTRAPDGDVHRWLHLELADGRRGFVRDDLLMISGDCSQVGYGVVWTPTPATTAPFSKPIPVPVSAKPTTAPSAAKPAQPSQAPVAPAHAAPATSTGGAQQDELRLRRAAFNITAGFEGGGYGEYQNYDAGIISYGRFQFTLAAGSLVTIVNRYLERAMNEVASELRAAYQGRLNAKDATLKNDERLKALLKQAANDPIMQEIQDDTATAGFWQPVHDLSITPRGLTLPLGRALLFDMAINHGLYNKHINRAEDRFGVPYKSRVGENGVQEPDFVRAIAEVRRDFMYRFADEHGFQGLKPRGDFWVDLANKADWHLQGEADGTVFVLGRRVQVRNP